MAFYYIDNEFGLRARLLAEASRKAGVEFVQVRPDEFDNTQIPNLTRSDFLYRGVAKHDCPTAVIVERLLLNDSVTTFYNSPEIGRGTRLGSFVIHSSAGIPIPKTVWSLTRDTSVLKRYVDYLGGFPVVIKVLNSSRGAGVMRADSWQSLVSLNDYLLRSDQVFVLREFIDVGVPAHSCRAVVLGGQVTVAYRMQQPEGDDFRSKAGKRLRQRTLL
ncbi:MAG: hypothetical protein AAB538_03090, partial [Patescibacteria group bacterium]